MLSELAGSTEELATTAQPQLRITHEEISRVCDLSRQTVTTILGELQASGVVRLGLRSIRLLDRGRLNRAADHAATGTPPVSRVTAAAPGRQ